MRLGEMVIFASFSLVCVFVCIISVLLLQVLLRCFLELSHTCLLASNACGESDRLLDTRRDRVGYQQAFFATAALCDKQGNLQVHQLCALLPQLSLERLIIGDGS